MHLAYHRASAERVSGEDDIFVAVDQGRPSYAPAFFIERATVYGFEFYVGVVMNQIVEGVISRVNFVMSEGKLFRAKGERV
jgi:hypothetical protein